VNLVYYIYDSMHATLGHLQGLFIRQPLAPGCMACAFDAS
jgi:hypothetical protein